MTKSELRFPILEKKVKDLIDLKLKPRVVSLDVSLSLHRDKRHGLGNTKWRQFRVLLVSRVSLRCGNDLIQGRRKFYCKFILNVDKF